MGLVLQLADRAHASYNAAMESKAQPVVRYLDQTPDTDCPYGCVRRVVTGGEGGVANVHVVRVTRGSEHYHRDYDEVYYVLSGRGTLTMAHKSHELRPGAVAVVPRGLAHEVEAAEGEVLEFIIFGTPGMSIDDARAEPRKP